MSDTEPSTSASMSTQEPETREIRFTVPGTVFTCGQGNNGQLGDDETLKETFTPVRSLTTNFVQIAAGEAHTACLSAEGEVWTFGSNDFAALGRCVEQGLFSVPGKVNLNGKVIQISAGSQHTLALMADGRVFMWGLFRDGAGCMKEDSEPLEKYLVPYLVDVPERVIKVVSGADHIILLTVCGKVYTAGCSDQGQLGRVSLQMAKQENTCQLTQLVTPQKLCIKGCKFFDNIWAAQYGSFVRDRQMGIFVFGLNDYGQLGLRLADGIEVFRPMKSLTLSDGHYNWVKIVGAGSNTVLLDAAGQTYCLGLVQLRLMGLGERFYTTREPTVIGALSDTKVVDIGCGGTVFYAVGENGEAFSWTFGSFVHKMGAGEDSSDCVPDQLISEELERGNFKILQVDGGDHHGVLLATQ